MTLVSEDSADTRAGRSVMSAPADVLIGHQLRFDSVGDRGDDQLCLDHRELTADHPAARRRTECTRIEAAADSCSG